MRNRLITLSHEGVSVTVVKFADAWPIEAFVVHFHHRAGKKIRWQDLDGVPDSLGSVVEATVANQTMTLLAAAREQIGWRVVIEIRHQCI